MEWIDGCTLEEMIRAGAVDNRLCRKIICEICDALDYIHRKQVIHRDLKPENIMITHNGQNVKIIDFGLSDADSYGTFKAPAGTRHYAAPELIAGEHVDARCDLWSLGVIINEMSRNYRHVAARCHRREISKRYKSAGKVKTDILHTAVRRLRQCILLLAIATAAVLAFFMPGRAGEDTVPSETADQEDTMVQEMPAAPMEEAKEDAVPDEAFISADELEQLFKDAAETIL